MNAKLWSATKSDEEKLLTFEWNVLRLFYGLAMENRKYRTKTNREIYRVYLISGIKSFIKGKRLEWTRRSDNIIKIVTVSTTNGKNT